MTLTARPMSILERLTCCSEIPVSKRGPGQEDRKRLFDNPLERTAGKSLGHSGESVF
jgi:hypothetical protein